MQLDFTGLAFLALMGVGALGGLMISLVVFALSLIFPALAPYWAWPMVVGAIIGGIAGLIAEGR